MERKYKTEQREIIINFLKDKKEVFISAEDIMNYLKKEHQTVGLTTIYRCLNMLEKENKLRTEIKEHTKFYQYVSDECTNHFHLKCKKCGNTIHLKCKEFEEVNNHIKDEHKFKLDCNTIIYGTCNKCNKE